MREIPWNKVLSAIKRRDVKLLRFVADTSHCGERRKLLLLFADIVDSGLSHAKPDNRPLPRMMARLVYDSFRNPLPVGVRGQEQTTRQVIYEAGPYAIDLRMEHHLGSERIRLAGQVVERKAPQSRRGAIRVLLISGKMVVANLMSNPLGEFQVECMPAWALNLHLPVERERRTIIVPLGEMMSEIIAPAIREPQER